MIDQELLKILCCPKTKVPVGPLPADKLAALNEQISQGKIKSADGNKVGTALAEGLITEDGATIYRVDDGIPIMLIDEGIAADQMT